MTDHEARIKALVEEVSDTIGHASDMRKELDELVPSIKQKLEELYGLLKRERCLRMRLSKLYEDHRATWYALKDNEYINDPHRAIAREVSQTLGRYKEFNAPSLEQFARNGDWRRPVSEQVGEE